MNTHFTRDRRYLALSSDVRQYGVEKTGHGLLGPQSDPLQAIFRILTLWRNIASLVQCCNRSVSLSLSNDSSHQMVNVCPKHFFTKTYGLGATAQKVSFWPFFTKIKSYRPVITQSVTLLELSSRPRCTPRRSPFLPAQTGRVAVRHGPRPGLSPTGCGLGTPLAVRQRRRPLGLSPSIPYLGKLLAIHPRFRSRATAVYSRSRQASRHPPPASTGGFRRPSGYWADLWRYNPALTGTPADPPRHRPRLSSSRRRPGPVPFVTLFGRPVAFRPWLQPGLPSSVSDVDRLLDVLPRSRPYLQPSLQGVDLAACRPTPASTGRFAVRRRRRRGVVFFALFHENKLSPIVRLLHSVITL